MLRNCIPFHVDYLHAFSDIMSQEYEYFYEDEVFRFNKKGQLQLGMVLENAELVSSDEESDIDEEDKVTKGNIRVAWYPNGEERVLSERKV